jgi:hypothetical protein
VLQAVFKIVAKPLTQELDVIAVVLRDVFDYLCHRPFLF